MADIDFNKDQYETNEYYTMRFNTKDDIEIKWGLRWRYVLNTIARLTKSERPVTLLDVGAGNGYFVLLASEEFSIDATGVGVHNEEIKFAKDVLGVQLINEDVAQHRRNYDVVTCFNVIEHVVDPSLFLGHLAARVKPGGILVLSTPNTACLRARIKGLQNWERIDPPHHINLFPRKSLRALISRHNLEEIKYETLSTYITLVNTKNLFLRRIFCNILRMFDLGADHFIITRKPNLG